METATVQRRAPVLGALAPRLRGLSADQLAIWAFGALAVVAIVGFLVRVTYPTYDSYYSLVWGREVIDLELPSFEAYRAPTEHPLAVAFGAALSLLGDGADRALVLATVLSLVVLAAGTYRLTAVCFTPLIGALAALLVLTRFDFSSLAVRGYIDIPFMAAVVWAGALEAARPRRGLVVFLVLAAAGLMRPEAWALSGLYFLWMGWDAKWRDRARYAALAAIGPVVWAATDWIVTGDPLFSLNSTQDLAAELGRQKSGSVVLEVLPEFLRETVKTPVFFTGLAGLAVALWRFPLRLAIPGVLFLMGVATFVASGLAGLSVIVRYLMVPSVMLCVFAALLLGGWTTAPRGSSLRRRWGAAAAAVLMAGMAYTALHPPNLARIDSELIFRGSSGKSLRTLLAEPAVRRGIERCGPVSVPTHKLVPDVRWILDLGEEDVVARSDPARAAKRRARYGVAVFPVGRINVLRTGFADRTDRSTQIPGPGFTRIAGSRWFAAYLRCPPGRA